MELEKQARFVGGHRDQVWLIGGGAGVGVKPGGRLGRKLRKS
jgi:hypothetical protein